MYKLILLLLLLPALSIAQHAHIAGTISTPDHQPIEYATIALKNATYATTSDSTGRFTLYIPPATYTLIATAINYKRYEQTIHLNPHDSLNLQLQLAPASLQEIVVTGTMKEVTKLNSPVPVEVYSSRYFTCNPTPSVFEALQNVNGVRPQINCNVCNTGDIHINGLEGPYTMILIDGMPIVSGLASVYGLTGIPTSLIDRVEIVKGPASTLYGSEAVGGLINVITRKPDKAPTLSFDIYSTSWLEHNADIAGRIRASDNVQSLIGLHFYNYANPIDHNKDNFTDVTLQDRISLFNSWHIKNNERHVLSLAARYFYEDRHGGEMQWKKIHRGGDQVYGESIYTNRWELFGGWRLPATENLMLRFSATGHDQNAAYGSTTFLARQNIGFAQLTWSKIMGLHGLLTGITYRYSWYDDNTPATAHADDLLRNQPTRTHLPGLFIQDEIAWNNRHTLLLGMRYDYNSIHGSILTPRINYKCSTPDNSSVLRIGLGNGYRVAHVFTEDHAALTGAREVVFPEAIQPERSWNVNLNYVRRFYFRNNSAGIDATAFFTRFSNKIIPDYDTDPNKIIYTNLTGYAISRGISLNIDMTLSDAFTLLAGATAMEVYQVRDQQKTDQLFTEKFSCVWNISYHLGNSRLKIDYTGNVYGPMRLPLLSDVDPRRAHSPWWSIQNLQLTYRVGERLEIYSGIKNLLNWTPAKGSPFIIARAHDPFDRHVQFDQFGLPRITTENPYGLTFDPTYVYAPNQGIKGFLGVRIIARE